MLLLFNMDIKKRKLVDKLDDLNQRRAMIHSELKKLELRKKELTGHKYQRHQEKYKKMEEKLKQKIRIVEEEMGSFT